MIVRVKIRKVRSEARIPEYAHGSTEDAGLDLSYCGEEPISIEPGGRHLFPTGISLELPEGFEGQVRSRSGLAALHGLVVLNSPGTIDPGFRGEVSVLLANFGDRVAVIQPHAVIAQLVVGPYAQVDFQEVGELENSKRGAQGFGSSDSNR